MKGATFPHKNLFGGSYRRSRTAMVVIASLLALSMAVGPATSSAAQSAELGRHPEGTRQAPQATCPPGGQCFADVLPANPFYVFINRLYQQDVISGYACGGPGEPCDAQSRPYFRPSDSVNRQQ